MNKHNNIIQAIGAQKMIPLFYHHDAGVCVETVRALYTAGIRIIEFTNRGEQALANFKELAALRNHELNDLLLAVGTIRNTTEVSEFVEAGADFLISPVFDTSVCAAAQQRSILWVPGCATPTEIHIAERSGCTLVKLFPGNVLGAGFVSAVKELFPNLLMMPTGGVEPVRENLQQWFGAGVYAVGMGSKLVSKEILDNKNYSALTERTKQVLDIIHNIKN